MYWVVNSELFNTHEASAEVKFNGYNERQAHYAQMRRLGLYMLPLWVELLMIIAPYPD